MGRLLRYLPFVLAAVKWFRNRRRQTPPSGAGGTVR
jgi:hypothetical protein